MKVKALIAILQIIGIILIVKEMPEIVKQGNILASAILIITATALLFILFIILKSLKKKDLETNW